MRVISLSFVRLILVVFIGAQTVSAQEIRRAVPVAPGSPAVPPTVSAPVPIRRALRVGSTPAPSASPIAPNPGPQIVITKPATVNDTARFLAGLPVSDDSSLQPLTQDSAWRQHATFFDAAWNKLDSRQLAGLRTWETAYLPEASQPMPVAFYLFSGPDFLYANQFFPNANTYVLAGTEPIGPLPDVTPFSGARLAAVLQNLQKSINSVLSFSFFITKDMRTDLQREELKGTLPIFYLFLARAGKTITDITFVTLDKSGAPQISSANVKSKSLTPGVRITFTSEGGTPQTLYYFTTDLSNDGIRSQPGFLKFCAGLGTGQSLLKSASYLMFENGFSTVRDFLLNHSNVLVQDDSGIPISAFDPAKWSLRFFGSYTGPIDLFKQYYQAPLQALYQQSNPAPLSFGIGYRWARSQSTLIVAERRSSDSVQVPNAAAQ